jgi:hypothetical protein
MGVYKILAQSVLFYVIKARLCANEMKEIHEQQHGILVSTIKGL